MTESMVGESKYAPLSDYLIGLQDDEWRTTFADVEAVLGFPLPESAHNHSAWWANSRHGHSHSAGWLNADWRTEELDLGSQHVVFRRARSPGMASPPSLPPKQVLPPEPPGNTLRCEVEMTWAVIGKVSVDQAGKLTFPAVTTNPAIYEFRLRYPDGRQSRYVGETANLRSRFSGYRNAAETQDTNVRLQKIFKEALAAGAGIEVGAVFENPWLADVNDRRQVVLSSTSVRRLMENVAILTGGGTEIETLNRAN